jgi:hypothetical protein
MSDYRSDREPLADRLEAVRRELREVRDATQQYEQLAAKRRELEGEAAALERELGARQRRRSLPLLDNVKVASPCDASWDDMVGDDRTRFCSHCQKSVHNLSAMASQEAERFLEAVAGSVCIRVYRRVDGTVLTADCPVGVRRRRRRLVAVTALALGGLAAGTARFFLSSATATAGEMVPSVEQPCPVAMGTAVPVVAPPVESATPEPPPTTGWIGGARAPVTPADTHNPKSKPRGE